MSTRTPRRLKALVVALVLPLAGLVATAPSADAVATVVAPPSASGIALVDSYSYVDPDIGDTVVTGVVQNTSGRTVDAVRIVIDQLDGQEQIQSTSYATALNMRLDAGEKSPFKAYLPPWLSPASWRIRLLEGDAAVSPANHRFTVLETATYTDENGLEHLEGLVRNDNTATATQVSIAATFLDAAGKIVDAEVGPVYSPQPLRLAAGEVGYFDLPRVDGPAHTSVTLVADAASDPSPLPVSVSISATPVVGFGKAHTVTGRVVKRGTDTGVRTVPVDLLSQMAGTSTWNSSPVWTDANGRISFSYNAHANLTYRLRVPASAQTLPAESGSAKVVVGMEVLASAPKLTRAPKFPVSVGGSLGPVTSRFVVQQRVSGAWVEVAQGRLKRKKIEGMKDSWTISGQVMIKPKKFGKARYRVQVAATSMNGAGTSKAFTVNAQPLLEA